MKTGLIYDPIYLEHNTGEHPENANRLVSIMSHLKQTGIEDSVNFIQPRIALREELKMVHNEKYINKLINTVESGGGWLDPDTFVSSKSYETALYASGGTLSAVEAVWNDKVNNVFALVRPPGHHAMANHSMGFCLFNNIAIAAKFALANLAVERILLVDFDVHHGNGTQHTFYNDPRVLYFSTHQFPFFPGSGSIDEIGEGAGLGFTVNFPMRAGWGDQEYFRIYNEVLPPIARRFQPQLILVSAGFDAHWADRLAMMQSSISEFAHIVSILKDLAVELCDGRLVFALEGGYNLQVITFSVEATFNILLGNAKINDPLGNAPSENHDGFEEALLKVKGLHQL